MTYSITKNFISGLPKSAYRNGTGKYEGVVAHSTASPEAPAINIRNFEAGHWRDAFVHFAVDWTSIIQIADTNYTCWGAGHTANQRYVSVELCETKDANKFKESYARYVWLLAKILFDRKLGVKEFGTFWTHDDVTRKLGGTTHSDPVAYLKSHGKSVAQLISDVGNEYNKMLSPQEVYTVNPAQLTNKLPSGAVGSAVIKADVLNIRDNYNLDAKVIGQVKVGQKYPVFKIVNEFYLIASGMWISNKGGKYATYQEVPKEAPKPVEHMYRVRKTWNDAKSQIGAFGDLENAKDVVNKNPEYKAFDSNGNIVYEVKQNIDHMYRVRKSWADAGSQIGAFRDLQNGIDMANLRASEGYKVFDENGNVVYTPHVSQPAPTQPEPTPAPQPQPQPKPEQPKEQPQEPVETHEGHNAIIGKPEVSAEKMVAFAKSVNPNAQNIEEIAKCFIEVGNKYGVRGDISFCQSLIETGWFKFDGGTAVTPDQHNYCGMGVTSKGVKGNAFDTVRDGVTAQIQHLYAYATKLEIPSDDKMLDPRFKYVARGVAPHWEDLNNHWAMNNNYGQEILSVYNRLVAFVPPVIVEEPKQEPEAQPSEQDSVYNEKQMNMIKQLIDYLIEKLKGLFSKN